MGEKEGHAPAQTYALLRREQPRKKARTSETTMQQPPGRAADVVTGAGQEAQSHETEQGEEGQVLERYFLVLCISTQVLLMSALCRREAGFIVKHGQYRKLV
jgi:hypothetical protein